MCYELQDTATILESRAKDAATNRKFGCKLVVLGCEPVYPVSILVLRPVPCFVTFLNASWWRPRFPNQMFLPFKQTPLASATDGDLEGIKALAERLSNALRNFVEFYEFLLKEAEAS